MPLTISSLAYRRRKRSDELLDDEDIENQMCDENQSQLIKKRINRIFSFLPLQTIISYG